MLIYGRKRMYCVPSLSVLLAITGYSRDVTRRLKREACSVQMLICKQVSELLVQNVDTIS